MAVKKPRIFAAFVLCVKHVWLHQEIVPIVSKLCGV